VGREGIPRTVHGEETYGYMDSKTVGGGVEARKWRHPIKCGEFQRTHLNHLTEKKRDAKKDVSRNRS